MRHKIATLILVGIALASEGADRAALGASMAEAGVPRPVTVARTRTIPDCTSYVDAGFTGAGNGSVGRPHKTIADAVEAASRGAVICVAEGAYPEEIRPGDKPFTLAGGFQSGKRFKVRDSSRYRSKAQGNGTGSFVSIQDIAPTGKELTAIDGFEITGYSRAIVRDFYVSQQFHITNNLIHNNVCTEPQVAGAGFSLSNVSGSIRGNVIRSNHCGRGGAGFLIEELDENSVTIRNNRIEDNSGTEEGSSHGGALYLFHNRLAVTGNLFAGNSVTGWGAGLYIGGPPTDDRKSTNRLSWNVYRNNRAGIYGGGFFCDDSAKCNSDHEIYDRNCGGNVYVDGASGGRAATIARFDHMTNVNARDVACSAPGVGLQVDHDNTAPDKTSIVNSIFWGNQKGGDLALSCQTSCSALKVDISWSMLQRRIIQNGSVPVTFGSGILKPKDPRFVSLTKGDFHLMSTAGHWTPGGYVEDPVSSPALAKGNPDSPTNHNTACAGDRTELGAYGNSEEASCVP